MVRTHIDQLTLHAVFMDINMAVIWVLISSFVIQVQDDACVTHVSAEAYNMY